MPEVSEADNPHRHGESGPCECQWKKEGHSVEAVDAYRGMFDAIMAATLDAIVVMGQDRVIRLVNRAALRLFRCEEADLVGKNVSVLIADPAIRAAHDGYVERHLSTGRNAIIGKEGRLVEGVRKD